ncbi:hypothetical protein EYC84_009663 [Monilinia fructicola]|uniref:Mid2 domain-containing protein n=1 Tax=Monilinia fructicola TaxID=38448 RepID=A0A5M9JBU7_MONFR|nr:hypothetical protein EYC84_009663 [Monilinia fructicola]
MAQVWTFETPISVNATFPVNLTWNPRTFNTVDYGNFLLNLWLLREDAQGDTVVSVHLPHLLACDHKVYNYSVLWTPTLDDIDFNVPQAGTHQLAWEQSKNNPDLNPLNTSFEGYSRGFNVKAPVSSGSSSIPTATETSASNSSATSSTLITSSTSTPQESSTSKSTSSSSGKVTPTVIGLVIGLLILLVLFICTAFWGVQRYRRVQNKALNPDTVPPGCNLSPKSQISHSSPPNSQPLSPGELEGYQQRDQTPAELPATRGMAEVSSTLFIHTSETSNGYSG